MVVLENDVQVAVDAEVALGAGRGYGSVLGVFWGTGVGGGIVLEGERWLGRGAAGEIGHMVVKQGGARCGCGRRGCLEAYAGRASLEARARRAVHKGERTELFRLMENAGRTRLTSGVWARALAHGDPLATRLIDRAVEALGVGIASAVNLLDVEAVVIGGGLGTRLDEPYVLRISRAMLPHLFVSERPPDVRLAALGDLGGAIGAALVARARSRSRAETPDALLDGSCTLAARHVASTPCSKKLTTIAASPASRARVRSRAPPTGARCNLSEWWGGGYRLATIGAAAPQRARARKGARAPRRRSELG